MKEKLIFYKPDFATQTFVPLAEDPVIAGFPNIARDYIDRMIDLNTELIPHPAASIIIKVEGDSMDERGISDGDWLIVDRSLEPKTGSIVIAFIDGEWTVKTLDLSHFKEGKIILHPSNKNYPDFVITPSEQFLIGGVVSTAIKKFV